MFPIQPEGAIVVQQIEANRNGWHQEERCAKLVASYWRRLEAVIAPKGASTKSWAKAVNTCDFSVFIFIYKKKKKSFLCCHCKVLCVEFWGEIFNPFCKKAVTLRNVGKVKHCEHFWMHCTSLKFFFHISFSCFTHVDAYSMKTV